MIIEEALKMPANGKWMVKFRRSDYLIDRHGDVDKTYTGRGDTFALACCRAALAAVIAEFQV